MAKSKGALLIARNNGHLDYVKQAVFLAKRIKKYLDIPTSVITDSGEYLRDTFDADVFDEVITIEYTDDDHKRKFYDGSMFHRTGNFKNNYRINAYEMSPYVETLLLDTDYIISNSILKKCFSSNADLQLFQKSEDIAKVRNEQEFKYISETSIDFYWATVVFFRKTPLNKLYFDLIKHVQEYWHHYSMIYQLKSTLFRNDFAFSIAAHLMNGFTSNNDLITHLPGKHFYTIDKDILWKLDNDKLIFLVEKKDYLGEYTALSTQGMNIHVMNKFSLERVIDEQ